MKSGFPDTMMGYFKILVNELERKGLGINAVKCQYFAINHTFGSPPLVMDCFPMIRIG